MAVEHPDLPHQSPPWCRCRLTTVIAQFGNRSAGASDYLRGPSRKRRHVHPCCHSGEVRRTARALRLAHGLVASTSSPGPRTSGSGSRTSCTWRMAVVMLMVAGPTWQAFTAVIPEPVIVGAFGLSTLWFVWLSVDAFRASDRRGGLHFAGHDDVRRDDALDISCAMAVMVASMAAMGAWAVVASCGGWVIEQLPPARRGGARDRHRRAAVHDLPAGRERGRRPHLLRPRAGGWNDACPCGEGLHLWSGLRAARPTCPGDAGARVYRRASPWLPRPRLLPSCWVYIAATRSSPSAAGSTAWLPQRDFRDELRHVLDEHGSDDRYPCCSSPCSPST